MSKIAVIGNNYKMACKAIENMTKNDVEATIKTKYGVNNKVVMSDGTLYQAISDSLKGYIFDQIITVGTIGIKDFPESFLELKNCLSDKFINYDCVIQHYEYYQ